jgi:hypothetical protein
MTTDRRQIAAEAEAGEEELWFRPGIRGCAGGRGATHGTSFSLWGFRKRELSVSPGPAPVNPLHGSGDGRRAVRLEAGLFGIQSSALCAAVENTQIRLNYLKR